MAKKRGQNEGSIYQRKDGLWCAQVTLQGKRLYRYGDTRRECSEWLKKTIAQIDNGLTFAGAQAYYEDFLAEWLISMQSVIRTHTHYQYSSIVKNHIVPALGNIRLKDLRPDQLQTLYNSKLKSGCSERMVIMIHAVLHRSLGQALKLGLINRNPADAVTRPKLRRKEMKVLDDNQVRVLLSGVKGTRYEAFYQLAVTTGLRQGELLGLKWSDLDWKMRKLKIQRQVHRTVEHEVVFSEPKTDAGRRIIVLGPATIEKLREHIKLQLLEREFAGDKWQENDLIFPSLVGTPIDNRNIQRYFKQLLVDLGLPEIRFHDLRHTAATLMLLQGIHPKVVQERLGHSEISMTLNIYSHVLPSMQEEAAEKLDELLTPIPFFIEENNIDSGK
jgi:integrase